MNNNQTIFILNLTFKANEVDLYKIYVESKNTRNWLSDKLTNHEFSFDERCDEFIEKHCVISRTFYTAIENFESSNQRYKIKISTDKKKTYETEMLSYKANSVNVLYNASFIALDNGEVYRDPPFTKKTTELFQFCQILKFCRSFDSKSNFLKISITQTSYTNLLNKISIDDSIEDVVLLWIHMREYLPIGLADEYFRNLDSFMVDFSKVPLKIDNMDLKDTIYRLIDDLNDIVKVSSIVKENKLFFVLNFILIHENYDLFNIILFDNLSQKKWIIQGFKILETRKEIYKINRFKFDLIIKSVSTQLDRSLISLFYSIISDDDELLFCLDQSWKNFHRNLLEELKRSERKISVSNIVKSLKIKSLESNKKIYAYFETKLKEKETFENCADKINSTKFKEYQAEENRQNSILKRNVYPNFSPSESFKNTTAENKINNNYETPGNNHDHKSSPNLEGHKEVTSEEKPRNNLEESFRQICMELNMDKNKSLRNDQDDKFKQIHQGQTEQKVLTSEETPRNNLEESCRQRSLGLNMANTETPGNNEDDKFDQINQGLKEQNVETPRETSKNNLEESYYKRISIESNMTHSKTPGNNQDFKTDQVHQIQIEQKTEFCLEKNLNSCSAVSIICEPENLNKTTFPFHFFDIFIFDLEEIFKIFLSCNIELDHMRYLKEKAIEYIASKFLDDSLISFYIEEKIEIQINHKIIYSTGCTEILNELMNMQENFPNEIEKIVLALQKNNRHGFEKFIQKITDFSADFKILSYQLELYDKIKFDRIFYYEIVKKIREREGKNLDLNSFFSIYTKEKLKKILGMQDSRVNRIESLLDKFLRPDLKQLNEPKSISIFVNFFQDLSDLCNQEEFASFNLEDIVTRFLKSFENLYGLDNLCALYLKQSLFSKLGEAFFLSFMKICLEKLKENRIEKMIEFFEIIRRSLSLENEKCFHFIYQVLNSTKRFIPTIDLIYKNGLDPRVKLFNIIFEYILKEKEAYDLTSSKPKLNRENPNDNSRFYNPYSQILSDSVRKEHQLIKSYGEDPKVLNYPSLEYNPYPVLEENNFSLLSEKGEIVNIEGTEMNFYDMIMDLSNPVFSRLYESILDFNRNFFSDNLTIGVYKSLYKEFEQKEKTFLLKIFERNRDDFERKYTATLMKFMSNLEEIKQIEEFYNFYFKNVEIDNKAFLDYNLKIFNMKDLIFKELLELQAEDSEIIQIYRKYSKLCDKKQFKLIFESIQSQHKSEKISFEQTLESLNITESKINNIRTFLTNDQTKLTMKQLIETCLPLLDENMEENIKEIIDKPVLSKSSAFISIINALKYYSKQRLLSKSADKLIEFIREFKIKKTNFSRDLENVNNNLKEYQEKNVGLYLESFRNKKVEVFLQNQELFHFVSQLNRSQELFEFFNEKEEDDLRTLIEFVDDLGDSLIKPDTIKNCLKVLNFSKDLTLRISKDNDESILDFLSNILNPKKNEKYRITDCFREVSDNLNGIKQLFDKVANREEYSKTKINEIHKNSKFYINKERLQESFPLERYKCTCIYEGDKQASLEEIKDLRDRSLFLSKKRTLDDFRNQPNNNNNLNQSIHDLNSNQNPNDDSKKINLNVSINVNIEEDLLEIEEKNYLEICNVFSINVDSIMKIYETLNNLDENGYHKDFMLDFQINSGDMRLNIDKERFSPDKAIEFFDNKYDELDDSYAIFYSNYPIMTFFYGRQILTLFDMFNILIKREIFDFPDDEEKVKEGLYLLDYLLENQVKIEVIQKILSQVQLKDELSFMDVLKFVGDRVMELSQLLKNNEYNNNSNNNKNKEKFVAENCEKVGLYSVYLAKEKLEKEIINIYQNFSPKRILNCKNILICDDSMSMLLIRSFIYRAFYYKCDEPFLLINSDELENDKQLEIHRMISILIENFNVDSSNFGVAINKEINVPLNMTSRLVITYNNPQLEYVNKIKKLKGIKNLNLNNNNSQNNIQVLQSISRNKEITVVKSDASGVGKSFSIRSIAKNNNSNYHYFPISGVIEKTELIYRLRKIGLGRNSLLHLDLNDCDNDFIVRSFLFELLITDCVLHNEFVFKLYKGIKIYIELPFGFIDFTSKFPILEEFNTLIISNRTKAEFDINENSENIQIVANYLLNYKNDKIINNNVYLGCKCPNNNHLDICPYLKSVPLVKMGKKQIYDLINDHFSLQEHSFYQIETFINFLAHQFRLFSSNFYFGVSLLKNNQHVKGGDLLSNRKILVNSFIDITKYFTKSAYNELLQMQENTQKFMQNLKNQNQGDEGQKEILKNFVNHNIISFNKIRFVMMFFNEDEQGISIIVKKNDPNYKMLYNIYNACSFQKNVDLIDYEKLTNDEFLEQLQAVLGKQKIVLRDNTGIFSLYNTNGYVFTSDNFLKMQLILLRFNSKIPVIMMGETGCGKTSLIKILADLLEVELFILNIHAGISDKDIINFIGNIVQTENNSLDFFINTSNEFTDSINEIEMADNLGLFHYFNLNTENNNESDEPRVLHRNKSNKIWVFLDEINTCNSLGLISEILCKRSYHGKKLPDNICFIAACNPYRVFNNRINSEIGLDYITNRSNRNIPENLARLRNMNQSLAYKVHPLPFSLLNFVFDFGSLSVLDELNYIESMICKYFNEEKIEITQKQKMIELIKNLIFNSQDFIRKEDSEISSVSLRDVRRFIIFLSWFRSSIFKRAELDSIIYKRLLNNGTSDILLLHSSVLSIMLIYYLRIPCKEIKKRFIKMLSETMKRYNFDINYTREEFLVKILLDDEEDILDRLKPPSGIAKNSALLENVFAIFHGINNKVPVYICGKPGCSKTLAIQLLYSAMRGENSKDPYLKRLPRLFMNCYQGSLTSKSSGIINVFKKARKLIKGISNNSLSNNNVNNRNQQEPRNNKKSDKKTNLNDNENKIEINKNKRSSKLFDKIQRIDANQSNKDLKSLNNNNNKQNVESNRVNKNIMSKRHNNSMKHRRSIVYNEPNNSQDNLISLVFFDEMGLAEFSKNNPLKVLHSELEPEYEYDKVAFVGISNWKLDASKSNRGIFIGRPDLDENDLIITAKTISESYSIKEARNQLDNKSLQSGFNINIIKHEESIVKKYENVFEALARAYYNYKKEVEKDNPAKDGFHGTRDFYYMIKFISKNIINKNLLNNEIKQIVEQSINRNFSGYDGSLRIFKKHLEKFYPNAKDFEINKTKAIQAIKSNLEEVDSRYLMIIGQSQVSVNLIQNIITKFHLNKNFNNGQRLKNMNFAFMIGSEFENDNESNDEKSNEFSEEYCFKVLNKIQLFMEQGNTLILSGLTSIYPSLYDLFNQNFTAVGGKKHARIALGTSNNPMAYVHNEFKCVIVLSEDELEKQDPPFLNRFEKANISFASLFDHNYYNLGKNIYNRLKDHFIIDSKDKDKDKIVFDAVKNMINFNENEIFGLVYIMTELEAENDPKVIEERILKRIIMLFSQDVVATLNINLTSKGELKELEKINNIYRESLCNNLEEYINKRFNAFNYMFINNIGKNNEPVVNIVYTYSSIFDEIFFMGNKNIKPHVNSITSFRCELELEKVFSNFIKNKDKNLFILKFRIEDFHLINHSKFLCEQLIKTFNPSDKLFIFILYTCRNFDEKNRLPANKDSSSKDKYVDLSKNKNCISLISLGDQIFIDNINGDYDMDIIDNQQPNSIPNENKKLNGIQIKPNPFNNISNENLLNRNLNEIEINKNKNLITFEDEEIINTYMNNNSKNKNNVASLSKNNSNLSSTKGKAIVNILDLINSRFQDLLNNNKFFDKEKIFIYSLYNSYKKIDYDSEKDEKEKKAYVDIIIRMICEERMIKDCIISKSVETMPLQDNWYKSVMSQLQSLDERCDLINIIKKYLNQEFQKSVTKTIYKSEQNQMMEYLLFNRENRLIFEHFCFKTVESIKNSNIKNMIIKDKVAGNTIKKIFGFQLPNSKVLMEKIIMQIDNHLTKIIEAEYNIRYLEFISSDDYEPYETKFIESNKTFDFEIVTLLKTNKDFEHLIAESDDKNITRYIIQKFLEDFILFFKSTKLSLEGNKKAKELENPENLILFEEKESMGDNLLEPEKANMASFDTQIIRYIKLLIKAETDDNYSSIETFSKSVSFLLKNVSSIQKFIEICLILEKYIPNFSTLINNLLNEIKYPRNDETKYVGIVNKGQYIFLEAISNSIYIQLVNLDKLSDIEIYKFLNDLTSIKFKILNINFSLKLQNKSVKNIKIIDDCKSFMINEIRQRICKFYKDFTILIKEERKTELHDQQALIANLKRSYKLINDYFKTVVGKKLENQNDLNNSFHNFLIDFLRSKYQSFQDEEYRQNVIQLILSEESLLFYSKQFIQEHLFYFYNEENEELVPFYDEEEKTGNVEAFGEFLKKRNQFMKSLQDIISKPKLTLGENYLSNTISFIFEINIYKYFNLLERLNDEREYVLEILEGSAFLYFRKAVQIWENMKDGDVDYLYPFMLKKYLIAYICIYLKIYVKINYTSHQDYDFRKINGVFANKNSRKILVLKLFVLKILKENYLNSWEALNNFDYNQHQMSWKYDAKETVVTIDENLKTETLLLNLDQIECYKTMDSTVKTIIGQNCNYNADEFFNRINDNNFPVFLDAIINNVFCILLKAKNNRNLDPQFDRAIEFFSQNFSKLKIRNNIAIGQVFKKISSIFLAEVFTIDEQDVKSFEAYFALFKYYLLILNAPKDSLFDVSNNSFDFNSDWDKYDFPGNYIKNVRKLYISHREIKLVNDGVSDTSASCTGTYLCSCENYYIVEPCGSPTQSFNCPFCNLPIGADKNKRHSLVPRPGHFRVFKNIQHKNTVHASYGSLGDATMAFKLVDDLKVLLDSRIKNTKKQFVQIPREEINIKDLTLPEIHPLAFRILNLIQNLFFYLNLKSGFLNEQNYDKCKDGEIDCKRNIEINMNLILQLLEKLNIKNIALFMDFVLDKIILGNLYNTKKITNGNDKYNKEIEISELVKIIIDSNSKNKQKLDFLDYKNKHLKIQEDLLKSDPLSLKTLLDDEKNEEILKKEAVNFPDFMLFKVRDPSNRDLLLDKLDQISKKEIEYPVTFNILRFEANLENLENFNKMNPFVNEMINRFSYQISRRDAKMQENSIESCINRRCHSENDNKGLHEKFNAFSEAWENIHTNAVQYECHPLPLLPSIKLADPVAYALNDNAEYNYGIHIAAGYQYLRNIQNEFLLAIKGSIQTNPRLFYLKKQFEMQPIIIQKAKPFQIVRIDTDKIDELIEDHCYLNFRNPYQIELNLEVLENELCRSFIQGKALFSEKQTFVVYTYEAFRGGNSAIITNFSNRIQQKHIGQNEKFLIKNYLDSFAYNFQIGERILATLTSMIFYLQNTDMQPNTSIFYAAENMKKYVEMDKSFKDFFRNNPDFSLINLVNIYNYIEKKFWNIIKENVSNQYRKPLDRVLKEKTDEFYSKNQAAIVSKQHLATATRRFVSRFLINEDEFDKDRVLIIYLKDKEEFWKKEIFDDERFDIDISNFMEFISNNDPNAHIKICEAIDFYESLGGDDGEDLNPNPNPKPDPKPDNNIPLDNHQMNNLIVVNNNDNSNDNKDKNINQVSNKNKEMMKKLRPKKMKDN